MAESISITVTNQAPVLSGANAAASILEDSAPGNGTLVSALIAGQVSDAGGALGIAVVDENSPSGGKWQYSLDGGTNWHAGTGSSFSMASDTTYAAGAIQVRQTDIAGNLSDVGSNAQQ